MNRDYLAGLTGATLFTTLVLWAALHDICVAGGEDLSLEYTLSVLCAIAYVAIYRTAFRVLTGRTQAWWLGGTLLLFGLLTLSAASATVHPKYPNDASVGGAFLLLTCPFLLFCVFRLWRLART